MNLRPLLEAEIREDLGVYAQPMFTEHVLESGDLSAVARHVRTRIERGRDGSFAPCSLWFSETMSHERFWRRYSGSKQSLNYQLLATNMGRLVAPDRVGDMDQLALHGVLGGDFLLGGVATAVVTFQGRMTLNFTATEPLFPASALEAVADEVVASLHEAST